MKKEHKFEKDQGLVYGRVCIEDNEEENDVIIICSQKN